VTEVLPRKRPTGAPQRQWRRPVPEEHINHYPPLVASAIAALAAVLIGYLVTLGFVMAAWLFAAHGSESTLQVLRATGIAWQVMHLVPAVIGQTTIGLLPWGFAILPIFILWKATQWALKSSQPKSALEFARIGITISLFYMMFALLVSAVSATADLSSSMAASAFHALGIALIATTVCIVSYAPSRTILTDALPKLVVDGIRPALIAFGLLFVSGSALISISLVMHWSEIRAVTSLMAPGILDGFFMTLLGIGYLPTVSVWSISYLMGPGIMLGGGSTVTAAIASPGALPAFPLLSILPSETAKFAHYLIVIPILVGVAIYFLMPRDRWDAQGDSLAISMSFIVRWREVITLMVSTGLLTVMLWLAACASSGPLGTGYLKFVGPVPGELAFAAIAVCGLSALITLVVPRTVMSMMYWWSHRESDTK
jgi:hypothetical protein